MLTEKQFDEYLRSRAYEPPSTNLAERIIAAARVKPVAMERGSFFLYVRDAIESLLPHPAYAFAFMLIVGIVVGMNIPANPAGSEVASTSYEEELL